MKSTAKDKYGLLTYIILYIYNLNILNTVHYRFLQKLLRLNRTGTDLQQFILQLSFTL